MKILKLSLICIMTVLFSVFLGGGIHVFAEVSASGSEGNPYTVEKSYDEETGELTYVKVEYSKNTYLTTNSTATDATGAPVDVSDDANYVFIPCDYYTPTEDTTVSIKFKNNGVSFLPMHVEYGAGISSGGVDYVAGFKYVCVDALSTSTWNVTHSKSVDGYNVTSVLFGSYAKEIYDVNIKGFRLYFDYSKEVNSTRSFEIFGLTVHEADQTPSFASDPKSCRLSSFKDEGGSPIGEKLIVKGKAAYIAQILDYSQEYTKLSIDLNVVGSGTLKVFLDEQLVADEILSPGKMTVDVAIDKEYSSVRLEFDGECEVSLGCKFGARPYVGEFNGSGFAVSSVEGKPSITYTFSEGWYKVSAPIRNYNSDYDCLVMELDLSHDILIGILIDDIYLRSHWEFTQPLKAGNNTFFFELSGVSVEEGSLLVIYFDPAVTDYKGVSEQKTVLFNRLEFVNSDQMPKAEITVDGSFEFEYDGKEHGASGATSNSGEELVYEYKLKTEPDRAYSEEKPVDAGEYDVRVKSPLNSVYGTTYAYSTLIINKITPEKPKAELLSIDYAEQTVNYDHSVLSVSGEEDFSSEVLSGSYVDFGQTLYFKYKDSANYFESEVSSLTLSVREASIEITVDYARETTKQNLSEEQEYSTDGINWITGTGKKVKLESGNIYLFRAKAGDNSFAGEITYIAAPYRPETALDITLAKNGNGRIEIASIEGAEYRLADTVWQDDNVFVGLRDGDKITVYVRIKATSSAFASVEVSKEFTVGEAVGGDVEKKGCGGVAYAGTLLSVLCFALALRRIKK